MLYELFTGKRVFEASTLAELIQQHESTTPKSPSQWVEGLNPVVERVILRCLEAEPSSRPRSAPQVTAALPGGDPLAAALAAGETPSPEMVAAAGGEGALRPQVAWMLLLGSLVVVAAIIVLARYSTDLGLAPAQKTPRELEVRAGEIIEQAGYTDAPHDLRRTRARLCHLAGGELEQIQFLLGHASIETTERYLGCKQKLRHAVNDAIGLEDT